ncbi:MAG: hypothetical protein JXA09_04980 [Anaerolineae bacterium]|nr:hypothetical protein [Anaerolineae bacterium]
MPQSVTLAVLSNRERDLRRRGSPLSVLRFRLLRTFVVRRTRFPLSLPVQAGLYA